MSETQNFKKDETQQNQGVSDQKTDLNNNVKESEKINIVTIEKTGNEKQATETEIQSVVSTEIDSEKTKTVAEVQEQPKAVEPTQQPEQPTQQPAVEVKKEVVQEKPKEPIVRPTNKPFEIKEDSIFLKAAKVDMRVGKGYTLTRISDTNYQTTGVVINGVPAFNIPYPLPSKELGDMLYTELLEHEAKFGESTQPVYEAPKQKEVIDYKKYEGIPLGEVDLIALAENLTDGNPTQNTEQLPVQQQIQSTFQVHNPNLIPNPVMGSNTFQQQIHEIVAVVSDEVALQNHADTMFTHINSHWRVGMQGGVSFGEIMTFINQQKNYKHEMKQDIIAGVNKYYLLITSNSNGNTLRVPSQGKGYLPIID